MCLAVLPGKSTKKDYIKLDCNVKCVTLCCSNTLLRELLWNSLKNYEII